MILAFFFYLEMVTTVEEEGTLCVVLDCTPEPVQRRTKLRVRPSLKVSELLDYIKRQYSYDSFVLKLQSGNFDHVRILKDSKLHRL